VRRSSLGNVRYLAPVVIFCLTPFERELVGIRPLSFPKIQSGEGFAW